MKVNKNKIAEQLKHFHECGFLIRNKVHRDVIAEAIHKDHEKAVMEARIDEQEIWGDPITMNLRIAKLKQNRRLT